MSMNIEVRLVGLGSGLLLGAGLMLAGMTRPEKVLAFLDVAGEWDPSLAFAMAGAIGVFAIAAFAARARLRPLWAEAFQWPEAALVDAPLVLGSALFGIGWGIVGYCPGPAIVSVGAGSIPAAWFTVAMGVGMVAYRLSRR